MYSEIAKNKRKTIYLIFFFLLLIAGIAYFAGIYFGDYSITIGAMIGALIYVTISYFASSKAALTFNGAKQIEKKDDPRLWRTVENLAITEGLPMPKVYIIEDPGMNAFATGRNPEHASVAITTGLLNALEDSELQGVMAHELGHVKNYDIRVSMVVFGLVAIVSIMADIILRATIFGGRDNKNSNNVLMIAGIVAMIITPIIAAIIQSAVSRKREYLADATGALTTRYPEGLVSALEKIRDGGSSLKKQNASTAHFFFANPLKGGNKISSLFSTHPPVDERISKLRSMGSQL